MDIVVIPTNEEVPCSRWKAWAGKSPWMALLYVDQRSPQQFMASISYITGLARQLKNTDPQIQPLVNVPFPGLWQMGAVANGEFDADYRRIFTELLGLHSSASAGRIIVRLPWEFNLDTYQTNCAKDRSGKMNPALYILAFRRIVNIGREVSPRFFFDWCPNHGKQLTDGLEAYYPGDAYVDEVSFDFYYQKALWLAQTAAHAISPSSGYGFQWLVDFARAHGKPWAIAELGADADSFAPELSKLLAWAKASGCRWIGWWDRKEVIDTRISDGSLPAIGAVVKAFI